MYVRHGRLAEMCVVYFLFLTKDKPNQFYCVPGTLTVLLGVCVGQRRRDLYLLLVSVWNVNGGFCHGFSSHVPLTS